MDKGITAYNKLYSAYPSGYATYTNHCTQFTGYKPLKEN